MKTADAIIQARLSSSRLKGKVLMNLGDKKLLDHVVLRLRASAKIDRIIIATTTDPEDQELADYCAQNGILCYRGDRNNVLARYIGAANAFGCETIVRVCSDNPFIDSKSLDELLREFFNDSKLDYATHATFDGVPIILKPIGVFAEVVTLRALKRVVAIAPDPKYFEHVTMFIYQNPNLFRIKTIPLPADLNVELRFTVDYPEDVKHCERVMSLTNNYGLESLLRVMRENPSLQQDILAFSERHLKRY